MTFNAKLCNYTSSFVHAIYRTTFAQICIIVTYIFLSDGYSVIQKNIFITTASTGDDASHRPLQQKKNGSTSDKIQEVA